ncbi:hypothetical protein GCM10010302_02570 [Streptomyces polychromogenes]|uniref:Carrier domain-containing protein n=1 Tax=Streptomyces polychromogenes TaxID=67342 RepID=A0ABN0UZZ0_9ACTN
MTAPTTPVAAAAFREVGIGTAEQVHSAELDCVQANLAVLADHHHGPATHLRMGAETVFRPRSSGTGGLPTVEPTLDAHLATAARVLGLAVHAYTVGADAAEILEQAERTGETVYVVADAFHLPWVPYHRRQHMSHSFLLSFDGTSVLVTDAYRNVTPWGEAQPGQWRMTPAEFAATLPDAAVAVLLRPVALPAAPAPSATHGGPAEVGLYMSRYASHPDRVEALRRLCLETWLLARTRKLAVRYRAAAGLPERPGTREWLRSWDALCEQVFLACRRVERGRAEPVGALDRLAGLLAAEPGHVAGPAGGREEHTEHEEGRREHDEAGDGVGTALYDLVARTAATLLGTDVRTLSDSTSLDTLPGFTSFLAVELVERLETDLGIEFDAADLVPEVICRLDGLVAAVRRSGPATRKDPA